MDAICINQENDEEKSSQVAMMADIFKRAQRVTVWLGPAAHNSRLAMKLLNVFNSAERVERVD